MNLRRSPRARSRRSLLALSATGAVLATAAASGARPAEAQKGELPAAVRARLDEAMREAILEARLAERYPYGAVLLDVVSGATVFRAHNTTVSSGDPSAHAEVNLLRGAGIAGLDLTRTFLVTSAESCPMCASAQMWARIAGCAYGTSIPDLIRFGIGQIAIRQADVISRTPFWTMPLWGGVLRAETDPLYAAQP